MGKPPAPSFVKVLSICLNSSSPLDSQTWLSLSEFMEQEHSSHHNNGERKGTLPARALSAASSVASILASSYQAVKPQLKMVLEEGYKSVLDDGFLARRPQEMLYSCLQPFSSRASHYSPLPRRTSIRLLKIHNDNANSVISCSLRVVDLEDGPDFKALSYSWARDISLAPRVRNIIPIGGAKARSGDEEESRHLLDATRVIWCNGERMNIYQNLHDALLQLRRSSSYDDYWIDAVCINQDDLVERNQQVQMMGRIYSCAKSVTIWLGTCPLILSSAIAKLEHDNGLILPIDNSATARDKLEAYITLAAGRYLFSRRYFSRLWVLQEICLSQKVELYLGENNISLETLVNIFNRPPEAERNSRASKLHPSSARTQPYFASVSVLSLLLQTCEKVQHGEMLALEQWLELVKGRQASDPRDFVNAGLSLIRADELMINQEVYAEDESHGGIKPWSKLNVDYTVGTTEVLLHLAACMLSKPGGVRLLSYASRVRDDLGVDADYATSAPGHGLALSSYSVHDKVQKIADRNRRVISSIISAPEDSSNNNLATMPSWIPNLGSRSSSFHDTFTSQGISTFAACTSTDNQPKISSDGTTLYIEVSRLGVINEERPNALEDRLSLLSFAADIPPRGVQTGESGLEALAQTCFAGTWATTFPDEESPLRGMLHFFRYGQLAEPNHQNIQMLLNEEDWHFSQHRRLEAMHNELPWDNLREQLKEESSREQGARFYDNSLKFLKWRSLFTTTNGYIGLGPSWMAESDRVMLVKGAHVPYIFRHVDQILARKRCIIRELLAVGRKEILAGTKKMDLEDALKSAEEETGKRDAWVLIGEAYVRGVMEGQAVTPMTEFERIGII